MPRPGARLRHPNARAEPSKNFQPKMNADERRFLCSSAFICVHLWPKFLKQLRVQGDIRLIELGHRTPGLGGLHGYFARCVRAFAADANARPAAFYRVLNEVPTVLMALIVILAVVKPF